MALSRVLRRVPGFKTIVKRLPLISLGLSLSQMQELVSGNSAAHAHQQPGFLSLSDSGLPAAFVITSLGTIWILHYSSNSCANKLLQNSFPVWVVLQRWSVSFRKLRVFQACFSIGSTKAGKRGAVWAGGDRSGPRSNQEAVSIKEWGEKCLARLYKMRIKIQK